MSCSCRDLCRRDTTSQLKLGYKNGQKYCKVCIHYWITEELRCPCCSNKIRNKPKYNRDAESKKKI